MNGLSKVDNKFLFALSKNSKASFTELGRTAHISRENAAYRLSKFVKSGLIKSFNGIINIESLGFKQYAIFLQLARVDKEKEALPLPRTKNKGA